MAIVPISHDREFECRAGHQENCIYIIEEKNWRIILYYLELAQINANYMTLHFLLNQKGPSKF